MSDGKNGKYLWGINTMHSIDICQALSKTANRTFRL
jgi:hypothetical protein